MLSAGAWTRNQSNTILFVLVDSGGNEVTGLGSAFTLQISKAGGAFVVGAGTKSEISLGFYKYVSTSGEADTPGPVAIVVTHASTVNQNLEYVVDDRVVTAIEFTYLVTSTVGGLSIEGVRVNIYTDGSATNLVWTGETDSFGIARDVYGAKPRLEPGTYFLWRLKDSYTFSNPDEETIS